MISIFGVAITWNTAGLLLTVYLLVGSCIVAIMQLANPTNHTAKIIFTEAFFMTIDCFGSLALQRKRYNK